MIFKSTIDFEWYKFLNNLCTFVVSKFMCSLEEGCLWLEFTNFLE